jgi:hypothetical protein
VSIIVYGYTIWCRADKITVGTVPLVYGLAHGSLPALKLVHPPNTSKKWCLPALTIPYGQSSIQGDHSTSERRHMFKIGSALYYSFGRIRLLMLHDRESNRQAEIKELTSSGKIPHELEVEKRPEVSVPGRPCKLSFLHRFVLRHF